MRSRRIEFSHTKSLRRQRSNDGLSCRSQSLRQCGQMLLSKSKCRRQRISIMFCRCYLRRCLKGDSNHGTPVKTRDHILMGKASVVDWRGAILWRYSVPCLSHFYGSISRRSFHSLKFISRGRHVLFNLYALICRRRRTGAMSRGCRLPLPQKLDLKYFGLLGRMIRLTAQSPRHDMRHLNELSN